MLYQLSYPLAPMERLSRCDVNDSAAKRMLGCPILRTVSSSVEPALSLPKGWGARMPQSGDEFGALAPGVGRENAAVM